MSYHIVHKEDLKCFQVFHSRLASVRTKSHLVCQLVKNDIEWPLLLQRYV